MGVVEEALSVLVPRTESTGDEPQPIASAHRRRRLVNQIGGRREIDPGGVSGSVVRVEEVNSVKSSRDELGATPGPIAAAVIEALTEMKFRYEMPSSDLIRFPVMGELGRYLALMSIDEHAETMSSYGVVPIVVPEIRRADIAELLTRINFGIRLGSFEMDYLDGEVRYRYAIDVECGSLSAGMAQLAIRRIPMLCDLCLDAMLKVIYGGVSAAKAYRAFVTCASPARSPESSA